MLNNKLFFERTLVFWRKIKSSTIAILLLYLGFFLMIFWMLGFQEFVEVFPQESNLCQWDCGWYKLFLSKGYEYFEGQQNNLAFFPLFPYLWKFSTFSVVGISILNGIITLIALVLLAKSFRATNKETLLFISIPSLFFCFVPYSEALFFFFSSLIILGYKEKKNKLLYLGLLGAALTRSVGMFFLPAIFVVEILRTTKKWTKELSLKQYLLS